MAGEETPNDPDEVARTGRGSPLERPIALFSPLFDLVLSIGDRVSRIAGPVDHEYYPVRRSEPEGEGVPREDPAESER
ncbi:MAG: hypothetical protein ACO3CR_00625 [Solirubrobacterales bacterium]